MRRLIAMAGLVVGLTATAVFAQSINVTQTRQANVYGVVQVGSQVRPVTVTQTGQANMAGVIQVGANARATINQTGKTNSASIGQYENILARGGPYMP